MFSEMTFDELNQMNGTHRSAKYEVYFGEMELSEEERKERISLAEKLEENFLFVLILLFTMQQYNAVDWEKARQEFESGYLRAIDGTIAVDTYMSDYVRSFSYDVIDSTKAHEDNLWYYSSDRGIFISENESLTSWNHQDFADAIKSGKTKKQWIDIQDKRERKTHKEVGRTTKPISEPFLVGSSLMMFPKDTSLGAESKEIINCRCTIKYF